jgi:hypothetical protein
VPEETKRPTHNNQSLYSYSHPRWRGKVKVTLEQIIEAQRGSRCIVNTFSLTSAVDGAWVVKVTRLLLHPLEGDPVNIVQ